MNSKAEAENKYLKQLLRICLEHHINYWSFEFKAAVKEAIGPEERPEETA